MIAITFPILVYQAQPSMGWYNANNKILQEVHIALGKIPNKNSELKITQFKFANYAMLKGHFKSQNKNCTIRI